MPFAFYVLISFALCCLLVSCAFTPSGDMPPTSARWTSTHLYGSRP